VSLDFKLGEQEVVCPYCGYAHQDSWEFSDSDDDWECYDCEKHFAFQRVVDVTYESAMDCEINKEEHNFELVDNDKYPGWLECTKCEATDHTPERKAELREQYRKKGRVNE